VVTTKIRWRPQNRLHFTPSEYNGRVRRRYFRGSAVKPGLIVFGSVFCIVGLVGFFFISLRPIVSYVQSQSWVAVPAVVDRSGLEYHSDGDGTTYSISVEYHYDYAGRTYRNDKYDFLRMSSSGRASKEQVLEGLRPGMTVTCYVDPQNPSRSVIQRWSNAIWFGLLPLAFLFGGLLFIRSVAQRPFGTMTPVNAMGRPEWLPTFKKGLDGGNVVLAPAITRKGLFIGFLLFAILWNAIISVFVSRVVTSHLNHQPEWFLTFFMTPFVVAGLVTIALVIRQFLAFFNPRITLTIDHAEASPGDVLHVNWQIDGALDRLKKLTIVFVGEEFATYRRGTNSVTDRFEFARVPVFESPAIGPFGSAKVSIPADAMHSFKANNNRITWSLKVQGDVPKWPDVEEQYELIVSPKGITHG
jgi:hypothetical protein